MNLPEKGSAPNEVITRMRQMRSEDAKWKEGKTFSLVYHSSDEHSKLLKDAYTEFMSENGLSPVAFPSLRRFEAEVVAMALSLFHGGSDASGSMTSGGTESVMMAVKVARDWARKEKGIKEPHVLFPETVHPAFGKAAHYFDLECEYVPVSGDFRVDVKEMEKRIRPQTALVVGSAMPYPHGVVDDITAIAGLAKSRGLLCHVDACLGGFILPFAKKLGRPIPAFDFEVDGVTSISADLHKYGFAAKGASLVMYRSHALRKHQFYTYGGWSGGLYASPTMTGTRPGGAIAAAWAALNYYGEEGYLRQAKLILETSDALQKGVAKIPGLKVLGEPHGPVFAFNSDSLNVYELGDAMNARGWKLDRQMKPAALHIMVTPAHAPVKELFLKDLEACASSLARGEPAPDGSAAMYGMVGQMPDQESIDSFLVEFLDGLYEL
jgi:sphinganine-1-phosphate aldolase